MTDKEKIAALEEELQQLREELEVQTRTAKRAVASYQQRALHMEIIRQQNEDLDRLAADLARAKRVEEERAREIETSSRLKSEFLANFSHEIRTPLNGIIGYTDLVMREEGTRLTPHGRRDLSVIKANARTLLSLINDILDLSKIEAGRVEVVRERVDVRQIVEECADTVRELIKGREVLLSAHIGEHAAVAFTDGLKLRQIVLNLLSNAAKFTESGEIVVDAEGRGEDLILRVEDTGVGIPADQVDLIFEKFRQVDGSSTRKVGGTGLGLAIVRELSRVLGGKVEVTSVLGRGSKFTVTLPGTVAHDPTIATPREREELATLPEGSTVLLVDDDPLVQQLLRGQLEAEGFHVVSATDGIDALRLANQHRPAAILLDILLPKLGGWDVLTALKSDDALSNIPVIIISVEEERARGYSLGACEYLIKPIEPDQLTRVVRRAIAPRGEVLVIDDDSATRELLVRQLRSAGFSAVEARDGEEALLRIRVAPPALFILDLMMPNIDGFEVIRRVRADGVQVPVLVLTGKDLSREEEKALREGLARVIHKGGLAIDEVVQQAKRHVMQQRRVESSRAPRILYVEDSQQNRDIVRRYLHGEFEVIEAEDGEHGLQQATLRPPDLILMDLSLPRLDGWEATRRLKADSRLRSVPVIALTAHAGREDEERARKAGCADYLTKPVEREKLIATIRRNLPSSRPRA
jgi:CheY-like chemotaxis protein/signal transduction histidine kinase